MTIWDLPNYDKTAKKTDLFLKTYPPLLARKAGINLTTVSSPSFTDAPSHSNINNQENKLVHGMQAFEMLQAIRYTMGRTLSKTSEQILVKYYLQRKKVWQIINEVGANHDNFSKLKKKALIEFSECWEYTISIYQFEENDRIHLQVFDEQA